jgi:Protein of unknown function (DUF1566)
MTLINRFQNKYTSILLTLVIFQVAVITAQIPRTISLQGVIANKDFRDYNVHSFTTRLYDRENVVYIQDDTVRVEQDGLFTILLGKTNGLPKYLTFNKPYVVEFIIDGTVIPMRIPLQTVPYAITSERVSDNSIEIQHLSSELKRVLNLTNPSEIEKMEKTLANYVGGFKSVIAGGDENRTSANYSSILGGSMNNVSGSYGTVTGGQSNFASGSWSFSGGGQNNRAQATYSASISGMSNIVTSSASFGTVSGGKSNQVGGANGTIGGGQSNVAGAIGSTISGGASNRAMQSYANISGGQNNIASGDYSTIGGGNNNSATNQGSTISGGISNKSIGSKATVSGGMNNEANGASSTISGGMNNEANADNSVISGGSDNTISSGSRNSMISGGMKNSINSGTNNGIFGSNNSLNSGSNSYVIGTSNTFNSGQSSITLGNSNQVSGQNTVAIGTGNIVGLQNEVVVGTYNLNSNNPANTTNHDFIGNRRFTVGIGNSASQRKNGMTIFENGNTLFQGKILTTGTAYLHSIEIANDAAVGGNLNVVGNTNMNGTLQVTGIINGSNLSGTNTGNVSLGTANGLSMNGQTLSLALATSTSSGAMSASDKTKLDGITGTGGNGFTHWIGEQYGGGVIFHLYKDNQGVEHGLILALNNQSSSQSWSNVIQEIGANAQSSWNGATNSNAIVSQSGHTNSAAKLCIDLVSGGQNDWYMPSIQELSLLWNNYFTVASSLTQITGAQLLSTYYWSSSEYCADYGWYIDFTNGNTDYNYKTNATNVRAIRAF